MDLVLKGRGVKITDQIRRTTEHKIGKLSRIDPRVTRVEVEVTKEANPRIDGGHRVEVACTTPRRVFRAEAAGEENFFLFGLTAEQVSESRGWYNPQWHYDHDAETRAALETVMERKNTMRR